MKIDGIDGIEVVPLRRVVFYNQRPQFELAFDDLVSCNTFGNKDFSSLI